MSIAPQKDVELAQNGWNFRADAIGNPREIVPLLGSYIPFSATETERQVQKDPRPSIAERYRSRDQYLQEIRAAAADLITRGYLLQEDMENVATRASAHWDYATRSQPTASAIGR